MDEQGRKMSKSLGNVTAPQEVADKYGVDILRLWVMMSDTTEDLRIGPEILKQNAELYRRLRNTLRWVLGSLAGFTEDERVPVPAMPELERWVLHRLTELDARIRAATESYDWTGVYPELHNFCATDLSAFYFDIRKDAIYCDRPGQPPPSRGPHRAGPPASLPDHLAGAGAVLHRGGSLGRPLRRPRTACTCNCSRSCRRNGATTGWRRNGTRSAPSAAASPCRWRRRARPTCWAPRCRPPPGCRWRRTRRTC